MRRLCGPLLVATGVLHLLVGLFFFAGPLAAIAGDGFGAVGPDPASKAFDREAAFWFMLFGVMLLMLGGLTHWAQARTGTLPLFLGWSLLALGVIGVVMMPASGFWLALSQAALMLAVARRGHSETAVVSEG